MNFLCKVFGWFCAQAPIVEAPKPVETPKPISAPEQLAPKSLFPKQEWADHVYALVGDMPKVKDEKQLCPNGMSRRNWVHFFAAIAKNESNFNPNLVYKENFKNSRGEYVLSTGLHQVSYESARGYGFKGITTEQLKDPFKNIEVAVKIVKTLAYGDGYAQGRHGTKWLGAARYFSVFRSGKAQATLKTLCE